MPEVTTHIVAPTEESAAARAHSSGIPDGTWRRVGPDPADLAGVRGAVLFAEDWRDTFPAEGTEDGGPSPFLLAAHASEDLLVEVVA